MTLETIQRRQFSDPDRFIDRYLSMEQSLGGRYVSADLFKETFCRTRYGASRISAVAQALA